MLLRIRLREGKVMRLWVRLDPFSLVFIGQNSIIFSHFVAAPAPAREMMRLWLRNTGFEVPWSSATHKQYEQYNEEMSSPYWYAVLYLYRPTPIRPRPKIWLCYDTCNAMDNQRIIQSTPTIFSFKSWTTDVVIRVGKVRGSATHTLASYLVVNSSGVKRRWL
jgi:hypothetical protein